MIYITGDTHADFSRFTCAAAKKLKKNDTLIVCGDFGFLWNGSDEEKAVLQKLNKRKFTVAFLDGKHENYTLLEEYPVVEWNGGKAQQIAPHIVHLLRGEIYTLEDETYFTFGGGESNDYDMREKNVSWWEQEMPTENEMQYGLDQLARAGHKVDYILTHEPSEKCCGYLANKTVKVGGLQAYFNRMEQQTRYTCWYFGSVHANKVISSRHRALFDDIVPVHDPRPRHGKKAKK